MTPLTPWNPRVEESPVYERVPSINVSHLVLVTDVLPRVVEVVDRVVDHVVQHLVQSFRPDELWVRCSKSTWITRANTHL